MSHETDASDSRSENRLTGVDDFMPWTESHSLISSDHRDPSTCDWNSIRTIAISEADGIQAIVGKPAGLDKTVTLSYLFAKYKGWTMEKAQDWFKQNEHTGEVPPGYFAPTVTARGRFDPAEPTVGGLVGVPLGLGASQRLCPDNACARVHASIGTPCLEPRACDMIASMNQNGSARFDPSRPTIGSLVGLPLPSMGLSETRGGASGVVIGLHPHGIREVGSR